MDNTIKMQSMNMSEDLTVEMCRRGNVKINLSLCVMSKKNKKCPSTVGGEETSTC